MNPSIVVSDASRQFSLARFRSLVLCFALDLGYWEQLLRLVAEKTLEKEGRKHDSKFSCILCDFSVTNEALGFCYFWISFLQIKEGKFGWSMS